MDVEKEIEKIQVRNRGVELDKAWETSLTRRGCIAVATYLAAFLFLSMIGIAEPYLAAFVPTGGYIFSTLSLSFIRKRWLHKRE